VSDLDGVQRYADQVGGVFDLGPLEAIPYNHWKRDMEWIVLLFGDKDEASIIEVRAYTAREAVMRAVRKYRLMEEENEL